MEMDVDGVRRLCRLARLELTEGELGHMAAQLGQIMDYLGRLGQVEAQAPRETGGMSVRALRPDVPEASLPREALLACAPETDGRYILVPGVREGEA